MKQGGRTPGGYFPGCWPGGLVAGLLVLAAAGCTTGGFPGDIVAQGMWETGEGIFFSHGALVTKRDGRVDIRAARYGSTERFLGIRVSVDTTRIAAPGTYSIDPAFQGALEVYTIGPGPGYDPASKKAPVIVVESEVSSGTVTLTSLPTAGSGELAGSFVDISLDRGGAHVLKLSQGSFRADVP